MDKQRVSGTELAGMVTKMIGVGGLQVAVNPDPVVGWPSSRRRGARSDSSIWQIKRPRGCATSTILPFRRAFLAVRLRKGCSRIRESQHAFPYDPPQ
jgi:hypothetical protein